LIPQLFLYENWMTPIRLLIFFKWQSDGDVSGSHFQIKMITGWNSSDSHSPNRKINPVVIFFQMTTGWPTHPVVNFFSNDNRMGVLSDFHIRTIVILNFLLGCRKNILGYRKNSSYVYSCPIEFCFRLKNLVTHEIYYIVKRDLS